MLHQTEQDSKQPEHIDARIDEIMGVLQFNLMTNPTKNQLLQAIKNRLAELKGFKS